MVSIGRVEAGMRVGLVGLGGLGMLALQTAVAKGLTVYGSDVNEKTFDKARSLGAVGLSTEIWDFSCKKLDVVVDFPDTGNSTASCQESRSRVRVGLATASAEVDLNDVISLESIGSAISRLERGSLTPRLVAEVGD